jgi:hypothetical protein
MMKTVTAAAGLVVVAAAATTGRAGGQEHGSPGMQIEAYLMEPDYEIALARSAGPPSVSRDATVLVLTPTGYEVAVAGTSGFTCVVERSWSSPFGPHGDFYNPNLRAPICYNRAASQSALEEYLRRTELALAGEGWEGVRDGVLADIASGRLRAPQGLAISYMLSDAQLLGTETGRFMPHLMLYVPYASDSDVGAHPENPHVMFFEYEGGPFAALILPATDWVAGPEGR